MFREQRNDQELGWRPTANWAYLRARASILAKIRAFFQQRNVLEVETPTLCHGTVTDVYLASLQTECYLPGKAARGTLWLQTSPEYAMKRLLAAGSGCIYQICKAFRNHESGRQHNPEFTMLEWYRLDFNHHDLMDEMAFFLQTVIDAKPAQRMSYADVFQQYLGINPHTISLTELQALVRKIGIEQTDRDTALQWLMATQIEPHLGFEVPIFIFDYPASQAALARVRSETIPVAERFEVYMRGIELANGFHELTDVTEQQRRFEIDQQLRQIKNLPVVEPDERFLAALAHGLPPCSGVALGIDRLVMLAVGAESVEEVISFSIDCA